MGSDTVLTSVFYYNLYKPYIVANANNRGDGYTPRRSRIANRRAKAHPVSLAERA